jgi:hypothetical protein
MAKPPESLLLKIYHISYKKAINGEKLLQRRRRKGPKIFGSSGNFVGINRE